MSQELTYRTPKVSISWPLGDVSTDSVKLSAAINLHPLVEFSAFSGKEAAEKTNRVMSADAAELMGAAQTLARSARTSPDCTVRINDGKSTLDFKGFLSGPNYRMNKGLLAPSFSMIAASTLMSNLKMDIYKTPGVVVGEDVLNRIQESIAASTDDSNLAARLATLTKKTIEYWRLNKDDTKGGDLPMSATFKMRRDEANASGPLDSWLKLLSNSTKDVENGWLAAVKKDINFNKVFNASILDLLVGDSRDFMDVINAIMGSFQLIMIPSRDGGPGRFISTVAMLTSEAKDLVLPASSIFLQGDSGSSLLPVQQVVVKNLPQPRHRGDILGTAGYQLTGGANIIGVFPPNVETSAGDVEFVSLPFFLSQIVEFSTPEISEGDGSPSLAQLRKSVGNLGAQVEQFQQKTINKMISDYARALYVDRALGFTRTSIQVPLDVSLWPGDRHRVVNTKGQPLFNGFLSGVQHSIEKKAMSNGGEPSTTLDFTHIEFPGFTLPGLK